MYLFQWLWYMSP